MLRRRLESGDAYGMASQRVLLTRDARAVYEAMWDDARPKGGRGSILWVPISTFLRQSRTLSSGQADRLTQVVKIELRQQRLIAVVEPGSALVKILGSDPRSW